MRQEPVDVILIRSVLEAVAAAKREWGTPDAVWEQFQRWDARRGNPSFDPRHILYHQLQDLYEFAIDSSPAAGGDEILRAMGCRFGQRILREKLSDFLTSILEGAKDLPATLKLLFLSFMKLYAPHVYRVQVEEGGDGLSFRVEFSDPEGMSAYLRSFGKRTETSLRNSRIMIAATAQSSLEWLIEACPPDCASLVESSGLVRIRLPASARFSYARMIQLLVECQRELEIRSDSHARNLDLERDLILNSSAIRETWHRIRRASATNEIILLLGEAGTGKTHLARRIHEISPRADRPFVEVGLTSDIGSDNFIQSHLFGHVKGAFTSAYENREGLFSAANTGTLFLDEIGDAGADLQAKLLRVLESRTFKPLGSTRDVTVDVRLIAATNRNLEERVKQGLFREDLYHRINVIPVTLRPLRERLQDLPLLAEHFIYRAATELRRPVKPLSPEAIALLSTYDFPGNLRELFHLLKHALLFAENDQIAPKDLPDRVLKNRPKPARSRPTSDSSNEEVIDVSKLRRLLTEQGSLPAARGGTSEQAWHIDHAKKTYLRVLIEHHRGNLRKIAASWDRSSEQTVRSLIRRFGLWDILEQSRKGEHFLNS